MTDTETVKLHVELQISYIDDDYDTGVTVEQWNAMTPAERGKIRQEAWEVAAQSDGGGIWATTPGATED